MRILVRRAGALGDVILTTPVIRRLAADSTNEINVETAYPDVFKNSPYIAATFDAPADRVINLDLAYEREPRLHVVQAYMQAAFGDIGSVYTLQQELFYQPRCTLLQRPRFVAVHAARAGWSNRSLPPALWRGVVKGIKTAGFQPILVGTTRDDLDSADCLRFFNTPIQVQADLVRQCAAFVGSDSAMLHVAGTTGTPIVGIFTCARPETRLPWRRGSLTWNTTALTPALDCVGCLAERKPPVTIEWCQRGDNACVKAVQAEEVIEAVLERIRCVEVS